MIDFQRKLNWNYVSIHQKLDESFIKRFFISLNDDIFIFQQFSEDLIDYLDENNWLDSKDWDNISIFQVLSEDFIMKNEEQWKWKYIFKCQNLSKSFRDEYYYKLY